MLTGTFVAYAAKLKASLERTIPADGLIMRCVSVLSMFMKRNNIYGLIVGFIAYRRTLDRVNKRGRT